MKWLQEERVAEGRHRYPGYIMGKRIWSENWGRIFLKKIILGEDPKLGTPAEPRKWGDSRKYGPNTG